MTTTDESNECPGCHQPLGSGKHDYISLSAGAGNRDGIQVVLGGGDTSGGFATRSTVAQMDPDTAEALLAVLPQMIRAAKGGGRAGVTVHFRSTCCREALEVTRERTP